MPKQTIAIDIDDVISASAEGFARFSDKKWGGKHDPEGWQENWAEFWDVPLEEAIRRAEDFHNSDAIRFYEPIPKAFGVLKKLKKDFRLIVVTSRRVVLRPYTEEWLKKHYSGIFEEVIYAGIWDGDEHVYHKLNITKSEVCKNAGCDFLIDDQLKHCEGAAEAGIEALLFGDYKWNQSSVLPKGVNRVDGWSSVENYFYG